MLIRDLIGLFFPRTCCICGAPLVGGEQEICVGCLMDMPLARGAKRDTNFVEKRLMGRIPVVAVTALLIFSHKNKSQTILHQIKYYGNERLALIMGRQLGQLLANDSRFNDVDLIIPVPLHPRKERRRGYNQSLLLCKGITENFPRPILEDALKRQRHTKSQTRKSRQQRLENMKDVFIVQNPDAIENKHVLLIDDVITTGATTEACCQALLAAANLRISVAALAVAGDN